MKAGSLRHRVTIEQQTTTKGAKGGVIKTWTTFAERWASVEPLQGREFYDAQKVNSEARYKVVLRYLAGVLPTMRVKYGTRTFEIVSPPINPGERNIELHLLCKEVS